MATRQTEFSISIEKLEIKFKGTQDLGQQIQQGVSQAIGTLMNTQSRLLSAGEAPLPAIDATAINGTSSPVDGPNTPEGALRKAKQPRPRRAKGVPSIANLLSGLKQDSYFSQARTSAEVLVHLKENKGHNVPEKTLRTELKRMVQRAELFRITNADSVYVYKDTIFDEAARSPNAAEKPAH